MTYQAEVLQMARAGMRPCDIAEELGISRNTVYSATWRARNRGEDVPTSYPGRDGRKIKHIAVELPEIIKDRLRVEAAHRGLPVKTLVEDLVSIAATDDLFNAILGETE